jgi:hypothetical protein
MNRFGSLSTLGVAAALVMVLVTTGCATGDTTATTADRVTEGVADSAEQAPTTEPSPNPLPAPTPLHIPPTPTPLPIETRTMLFTGDVLSHTPVMGQALRYGAESDLDSYSLNGFRLPDDEPWLVNLNDVDSIVAEAHRARDVGAELVVLSIQWGNEYQREPSDEQLALAHALTSAGVIDLIMGNHVHVVQPVATVNDVPVVYGLGNSLSNQSDNCCRTGTQDGVAIEATIQGNADIGYVVSGLAFAPTWVDRSDYTIVDLLAALDDPSLDPAARSIYKTPLGRTVEAIHSLGWEIPLALG